MTDRFDFEARLQERLKARAALASRPFDAAAIARSVAVAGGRRHRIAWFPAFTSRPVSILVMVGMLLVLAIAAALAVGALRPVPRFPTAFGNGWIAVSANPPGVGGGEVGDIYRVDDVVPVRVIGSDHDGIAQACPQFSPDGRALAYGEARASNQPVTSDRGDWPVTDRAIVVLRVDAAGEVVPSPPLARIAVSAEAGEMVCPSWSPDSGFIAFRLGQELRVADVRSGESRVFPVSGSRLNRHGFAWSHDGSRIAVATPRQILVIHVAGGGTDEIPVPVTGARADALGWTAGDERIVYGAVDGSGDGHSVRAVDLATRQDRALTSPPPDGWRLNVASVTVSPDGTRIAWIASTVQCTTSERCTGGGTQVQTMDLGTATVSGVPMPGEFVTSGVQWSPDGSRLLLSAIDRIESVGADGASTGVIHTRGRLDLEWSWDEISWQPLVR